MNCCKHTGDHLGTSVGLADCSVSNIMHAGVVHASCLLLSIRSDTLAPTIRPRAVRGLVVAVDIAPVVSAASPLVNALALKPSMSFLGCRCALALGFGCGLGCGC